ncbi:MAG: hypothetical protein HQK77_02115 [Desulfobacterales bacterium]|nr:hypothetical protein [Desulfobacterales bacterium]
MDTAYYMIIIRKYSDNEDILQKNISALSTIFSLQEFIVEELLASSIGIIKGKFTKEVAFNYKNLIEQAGIECRLEPEDKLLNYTQQEPESVDLISTPTELPSETPQKKTKKEKKVSQQKENGQNIKNSLSSKIRLGFLILILIWAGYMFIKYQEVKPNTDDIKMAVTRMLEMPKTIGPTCHDIKRMDVVSITEKRTGMYLARLLIEANCTRQDNNNNNNAEYKQIEYILNGESDYVIVRGKPGNWYALYGNAINP